MRAVGIGSWIGLSLLLAACGLNGPATPLEASPTPGFDPFAFPSDAPIVEPSATASSTVDPVTGATQAPARTEPPPPNNYARSIGVRYLINWLYAPVAVAVDADQVLALDAGRVDPRGAFGAVLEFNGRSEDAAAPVGYPYANLGPEPNAKRLSTQLKAVSADTLAVYVSTEQGVFGFMRDSRNPLNLGNPITGPAQDLAQAADTLYVAQNDQVRLFKASTFAPDAASPAIRVTAVGLGADAAGDLYVAGGGHVTRYHLGAQVLSFDGRGTDLRGPGFEELRDVAVDPRNGDVYALERGAIVRFDSAGRFLLRFATSTVHDGRSIAVGARGDLYVVDGSAKQVLQFDPGR